MSSDAVRTSLKKLRCIDFSAHSRERELVRIRDDIADILAIRKVTDGYVDHVASALRGFAAFYCGGNMGAQFSQWLAFRAEHGTRSSTLRNSVNSLAALIHDANSEEMPASTLRVLRKNTRKRGPKTQAMSAEQCERLMAWSGYGTEHNRIQQQLLLRLFVRTGLRLNEALNLRRLDVAMTEREFEGAFCRAIRVRYGVLKKLQPQRNVTWVPLFSSETPAWSHFLAGRTNPDAFLFQNLHGDRLSERTVQKWMEHMRRPGEKGFHIHAIRHMLANQVQRHFSRDHAKLVLAHSLRDAAEEYLDHPNMWPILATITYKNYNAEEQQARVSGAGSRGALRFIECGDSASVT